MNPELYGKCRELGYCDCGGFFGCFDPGGPRRKASKKELANPNYQPHHVSKREPEDLEPAASRPAKPPELYCDICKKIYIGKPLDHLRAVHDRIITTDENGTDTYGRAPINPGRERSMRGKRNQKQCPDCGKYLRKDHVCKAVGIQESKPVSIMDKKHGEPAPGIPTESNDLFPIHKLTVPKKPKPPKSVELELPEREVVIKLAGVEIIIRPVKA